jgi:exodeoxyribonuclease V gamma subunit
MNEQSPSSSQGLIVLQGNRMEDLRDLTLQWLGHKPLHPLARARFLVQSNGIAQWLKTSIAERQGDPGFGICLGIEIALPARFQGRLTAASSKRPKGPARCPPLHPTTRAACAGA